MAADRSEHPLPGILRRFGQRYFRHGPAKLFLKILELNKSGFKPWNSMSASSKAQLWDVTWSWNFLAFWQTHSKLVWATGSAKKDTLKRVVDTSWLTYDDFSLYLISLRESSQGGQKGMLQSCWFVGWQVYIPRCCAPNGIYKTTSEMWFLTCVIQSEKDGCVLKYDRKMQSGQAHCRHPYV